MASIPIYTSSPILPQSSSTPSTPQLSIRTDGAGPAAPAAASTSTSTASSSAEGPSPTWTTIPSVNSPSWTSGSTTPPPTPPSIGDDSCPPTPSSKAEARYLPPDAVPSLKSPEPNRFSVGWSLPQPNAFPTAPSGSVNSHRRFANKSMSALPPPPKAGEKFVPQAALHRRTASGYAAPYLSQYQQQQLQLNGQRPHQSFSHSPLADFSFRPGEDGDAPPNQEANVGLGFKREGLPSSYGRHRRGHGHARAHSLEHPPGYLQDPHASELSIEQRRALEALEEDKVAPMSPLYQPGGLGTPGRLHGGGLPGGGFSDNSSDGASTLFNVDAESVWKTARKWAQTAGEKLQEVEAEVWKRMYRD